MTLRHSLTAAVVAGLFLVRTAAADDPEKPPADPEKLLEEMLKERRRLATTPVEVPKDYRWEDEAKKLKLGDKEIEALTKNKVLMTAEGCKQIFEPYTGGKVPVFITSDSLLNAYHVLFEASLLRLERANARRLPDALRFLWKKLETADRGVKGNSELTAAAGSGLEVVIGTALRLLDDNDFKPDEQVAALIKEEAERVTAAAGQHKPKWMGPPDDGFLALDYSRYKPRGFYDLSEELQRYFRAVSWLQSVPFRADRDEELLAILLLGSCVEGDGVRESECVALLRSYEAFLPRRDNPDLGESRQWISSKGLDLDLKSDDLNKIRQDIFDRTRRDGITSQINDRVRKPPRSREVEFRVMSASRTPEAALFQRTTDPRHFQKRSLPSGLEVCAALGSSFARSQLVGEDRDRLLAEIDAKQPSDYSLYEDYRKCLRALLDKPEPDAPAFLSSEVWQAKSCQTTLGSWAQMRHAWVLHVKESVRYMSASSLPAGFAEPVPEFYARLEELAETTERLLRRGGALDRTSGAEMARDLRALADLLERKKLETVDSDALKTMTPDEQRLVKRMAGVLNWGRGKTLEGREAHARPFDASYMRRIAGELETGILYDEEFDVLPSSILDANLRLEGQWDRFRETCRTLERLAHRQLRRVPFREDEERFIREYGHTLASLMLYEGHAYMHPRDDAPRVVDVFSDPREGKYLEVGVGRPRVLFVLYPVKGGDILCRGAVMPYYEFSHAERLTDEAWKALLDSPKRPAAPAWLAPLAVPAK